MRQCNASSTSPEGETVISFGIPPKLRDVHEGSRSRIHLIERRDEIKRCELINLCAYAETPEDNPKGSVGHGNFCLSSLRWQIIIQVL